MDSAVVGRIGMRTMATAGLTVALVAGMLALPGSSPVAGQDAQDCPVENLGTLKSAKGSKLETEGRWTTEDCDSLFRVGSDAHTYKFRVAEAGRLRINLASAEADSRLYLLTEAGERIADDDDGGASLDARIEIDLAPGSYLIEAATTSGRSRGPADFTLTVSRVEGCEPVHLGTLEPGKRPLTASGSWTLDTCGSRFVAQHPAHGYTFNLARDGRVRIDLMSEDGDPVLSLVSPSGSVIGANDDGGERRNARIENYLQPGVYYIEATTYLERDYQPLHADFTLGVTLVDERAQQRKANLKIEEVHTPAHVVIGDPFEVNYRVGNLGGGPLEDGSRAVLYVVGRRVFDRIDPDASLSWRPGASYHTGDEVAHAESTTDSQVAPFEVVFNETGPAWLFTAVIVFNAAGEETGFHGFWQNLVVRSHSTFDPVGVEVDGEEYTVSATVGEGEESRVTISVVSAADPEAEVDPDVRAKAIYAAGVRAQLLDGIFERSAVAALSRTADPEPVRAGTPSSEELLKAFGQRYSDAVSESGLAKTIGKGEAVNPIAVEELVLGLADDALAQYAWIADSWSTLLERIADGGMPTFEEALAVQSQLAYVESLISPAVAAGKAVAAARVAETGWEDADVRAMLADRGDCAPDAAALRGALEAAGAGDVDDLLVLDAEMRAARPVHSLAVDGAICAAADADTANARFLARLSIGGSKEVREVLGLAKPPARAPEPAPHRLRIIARLGDDGRVEHGVEFADGEQVLPPARFLPASTPAGRWQVSKDVEVAEVPLGRIRTRRLDSGRIEMGFISADGDTITPDIARLPAELPEGVWFRSSEIEVPKAMLMGVAADDDG